MVKAVALPHPLEVAMVHAERDEMARLQAEAARHEAECHQLWQERIAAGECPF